MVVLFCCFVNCVSLALKSPYGEWSIIIKYVLYCIVEVRIVVVWVVNVLVGQVKF